MILLLLSRSLAHSYTLASFFTRFPNLPMCVFRLHPLFIQSDETSRPDGRWIIMSFIFKSTALSSQWRNQFKYLPKLQPSHTPTTARCKGTFSHSAHLCFYKHAEDIVLSAPRWPHIFVVWLAGLCPGCRNHICPAGPSHLQPNQFVSSLNNGACVWQRWMRAQGSS